MKPRLVFATRNPGKLTELRVLVADLDIDVLSLDDIDRDIPDVIEDRDTFIGNASKKALEISQATGMAALADDSGLEVDALDGGPGVYSARYAGEDATDDANNDKLLAAIESVPDEQRTGRFRSCLALADVNGNLGDGVLTAEGACEGVILRERRGTGGFGYDPLFYVPALGATFAELGSGTKNDNSHRAAAMRALKPKLAEYFQLAKPRGSG